MQESKADMTVSRRNNGHVKHPKRAGYWTRNRRVDSVKGNKEMLPCGTTALGH